MMPLGGKKGKFPNNTIHLISYSLRLPLPGDCERYAAPVTATIAGAWIET